MSRSLIKILFLSALFFLSLENVNAQRRRNTVQRDTIWIMDGKYYTYDPLKKAAPVLPTELVVNDVKPVKKKDYRSLV
ncbi:hypothetical protein, partial [Flavobacterium sp.]|uniref:hypothetical protein n=1 Tax=Flavobacterium sp. TaxID=239 RepID=UPI0040489354